MDQIHEACMELTTLGIITSSTQDTVTLDLKRLYVLGYVLVFDLNLPVFTTILDFNYMYDPILFYNNVIPKASLGSFVLAKLKNNKFSL